jgi:hypothetical protein
MFMMIRHCGPEPVYNAGFGFIDVDRRNQVIEHAKITGRLNEQEDAQTYTSVGPLAEIDPTSQIPPFFWTPLRPDDEQYAIRIVSRDRILDETLKIVRRAGKWFDRIKVTDITTGGTPQTIINCSDAGFLIPGTDTILLAFRITLVDHIKRHANKR